MVPWLVAPLVILIWTLLVMPTLMPGERRPWGAAWGGIAVAVIFVAATFAIMGTAGGTPLASLPSQNSPGFVDPSGVTTGADWTAYGGTNAAWRFTPLTQINPDNVGKLRKVWEVHLDGQPNNPDYLKLYGTENTPLKAGNMLYTCTAKNVIVALDAVTGKPVWRVDPQVPDKWIPTRRLAAGCPILQCPAQQRTRSVPSASSKARWIRGSSRWMR